MRLITTETFMPMSAKLRGKRRATRSDHPRQGAEVDSFLGGPSFDRKDRRIFIADFRRGRTVLDLSLLSPEVPRKVGRDNATRLYRLTVG